MRKIRAEGKDIVIPKEEINPVACQKAREILKRAEDKAKGIKLDNRTAKQKEQDEINRKREKWLRDHHKTIIPITHISDILLDERGEGVTCYA